MSVNGGKRLPCSCFSSSRFGGRAIESVSGKMRTRRMTTARLLVVGTTRARRHHHHRRRRRRRRRQTRSRRHRQCRCGNYSLGLLFGLSLSLMLPTSLLSSDSPGDELERATSDGNGVSLCRCGMFGRGGGGSWEVAARGGGRDRGGTSPQTCARQHRVRLW